MRKSVSALLTGCLMLGVAGAARADDATKAIIDKAITATGGEAKLTKAKAATSKAKGTYHGMGQAIPYTSEHAMQLPTQYRAAIEAENFKMVVVANGDKGWVKINGELQELDKDKLAEQKETLHAALVGSLVPLKDKAFTLSPLGDAKVGDHEAVGVKVSHKDRRDVNLYFDKKTGLLVKMEHRVKDDQSGQEMNQETFFSDYKKFDDVQEPTKVTIKRDGNLYVEEEITEWKHHDKLDDSTFDKP